MGEIFPFMKVNQTLLQACIDGDRKAQSDLYGLSFSTLMSVAYRYRMNRDDAVSIVNQSFLKILNGLTTLNFKNGERSYFKWIQRIMINTVLDDIRKNARYEKTIHFGKESDIGDHFWTEDINDIEEKIEEEALQEMLGKLSETQRNVFNLYAIDGFSHKEIASSLNIGLSNSKWHLAQARKKLQFLLKEILENQKTTQNG